MGELRAMGGQLRHRGPEEDGIWTDGPIGLAHTRLSIIDLAGGLQPIGNETGTLQVVFNGEIFNHVELRAELEGKGHRFRTRTDTEVIVHLYEELGEDFVHRLNGQFAIGLWDGEAKKLILVRDRAGIVPLYYSLSGKRLLFASEIKALLPLLGPPSLDPVALDQVMTLWAPVSPRTMFQGVQELPPGHLMVIDGGRTRLRQYWDWGFPTTPEDYLEGSEKDLARALYELLLDATSIRLRADVPVGAYLSGGIDSSALAHLAHQAGATRLRTFSIGFETEDLDERAFQQLMIGHIGAEHSGVLCTPPDVAREFPDTIRHTEIPVLRTAPAPMKLLSKLVAEAGYKTVLTGEGADEVLGGYDLFKEAKVRRFWSRRPDSAWRPLLIQRLYPYLDLSTIRARGYVQSFFGIGLDDPDSLLFSHLPRWATSAKTKEFLSAELAGELAKSALEAIEETIPPVASRWHPFNRGQYLEAKSLLAGYLLNSQGDRMLMANSVEGRVPFLDHRVIEFANRLDPKLKMRVLREKHLLKLAMEGSLPSSILERHKQPYRGPESGAFFAQGRAVAPYVDELLSEDALKRSGYFDAGKVSFLARKARGGALRSERDNQAFIGILSTQIWHHLFVERYHSEFALTSHDTRTHVH